MSRSQGFAGALRRSLALLGPVGLLALAYLFLLAPNLVVLPMSLGNEYAYEFPPKSYSLVLYQKLFADSQWLSAAWLSLRVAVLATVGALVLGVPAAYGLVRGAFPGRRAILLFLMSPILVPVVVIALGLYLHFARLQIAGSMLGMILAHTLYVLPFVLITAVAGMRHIDRNLETVASMMGAGRLTVFFRVTLPLLRPALVAGALFALLMSFDEVVIAFFLVDATAFTLPVKMYSSIQHDVSPVLAAVSSILTILSIVVCLAAALVRRR
jgi:putative spermidine/putrescine transport system permease protein